MKSDNMVDIVSNNGKVHTPEQRKRRIHRMKIGIVVIVTILLLLPTLLCIILGIHMNRLQKQVNDLISIHKSEGTLLTDTKGNSSYAYAAEIQDFTSVDDIFPVDSTPSGSLLEDAADAPVNVGSGADTLDAPVNVGSGAVTLDAPVNVGSDADTLDAPVNVGSGADTPAEPVNTGSGADTPDEPLSTGSGTDTPAEPVNTVSGTDTLDVPVNMGSGADTLDVPTNVGNSADAEPGIYAGKKVYLTFDDGPSIYTDELLDIFSRYGVKATFFVIGKEDKDSKRLYKRIVDEGHTLGMHSYTHIYKQIYNSLEDFDKDFTKLWKLLYDTTGTIPIMYRFPGGSYNKVSENGMEDFIRYLNEKSILYYDWNVVNGDATDEVLTVEQLINNVLEGVAAKKRAIVLMHDVRSNRTTLDSLPEILEKLLAGGAEVLPLTAEVPPIQQIKADSIK